MVRVNFILFLVIFLEGYAVLSTELLAIRQIMPFLGSGTDMVAIIIAAVLMPLAFGYASGGRFRPYFDDNGKAHTIRRRLLLNLSLSALILSIGLSHATLDLFFSSLYGIEFLHTKYRQAAAFSIVFIVLPVFMLGQTVPLLSNYFRHQHLASFAGRVLFFSTLGSFMGSIFCTLVLMPRLGVHNTVLITIACLSLLTALLSRKVFGLPTALCLLALLLAAWMNGKTIMGVMRIVADDQYMTVQVDDTRDRSKSIFKINGTWASALYNDPARAGETVFPPLDYIEKQFIYSLPADSPPLDILVIGSGGFNIGMNDPKNNYTYLDIDPDLQDIAEANFLHKKLGPHKKFLAEEARGFVAHTKNHYDLVILDPYQDRSGIPLGLVSVEFFQALDRILKPVGIMTGNFVGTNNFSDTFSIRLDNTMRQVFPNLNRQALTPYNGWAESQPVYTNIVYSAFKNANRTTGIYTDDLNSSYLDKLKN